MKRIKSPFLLISLILLLVVVGCTSEKKGIFSFASNGERIFFTATSKSGRPISIKEGPPMVRNNPKGCAHCHGKYGRGGRKMDISSVTTPDIRYSVLKMKFSSMLTALNEDNSLESIDIAVKRAMIDGIMPGGSKLSIVMPRWDMDSKDLDDLMLYLKQLD